MDLTLTEISDKIVDTDVKGIVDNITLPASLTTAELLAKIFQAASQAAAEKNQNVEPGDANYVGAYPPPGITTNVFDDGKPPETRTVYALVVVSPISLDKAVSPKTSDI